MNSLKVWLGTGTVDPFELAVTRGMAAQESITATLLNFFELDTDVPDSLKHWAKSLTSDEVKAIKERHDEEREGLCRDIDTLLVGEMDEWTDAERAHAAETSRRLTAVNLVLQARDAAAERRSAFRPTEEMTATAAA